MLDVDEILKNYNSVDPGFKPELATGRWFVDAIFKLHSNLQPKYENLIQGSGPSFPALAGGQISARAVTLIRGITALDKANEFSMAFTLLRAVEENAGNLFYILYAGPAEEGRSASDFAEQFLAYRDFEHARMINKARSDYTDKFRRGWKPPLTWGGPRSVAEFDRLCDQVKAQCAATLARFPSMSRQSWHNVNKEDRTTRILANLPNFAKPAREVWSSLADSTSMLNMLLHSSPMLFQKENINIGHVLDLGALSPDVEDQSIMAAKFAELCWFALGDVLNDLSTVMAHSKQLQNDNVREIAQGHHVPAMWRLGDDGSLVDKT